MQVIAWNVHNLIEKNCFGWHVDKNVSASLLLRENTHTHTRIKNRIRLAGLWCSVIFLLISRHKSLWSVDCFMVSCMWQIRRMFTYLFGSINCILCNTLSHELLVAAFVPCQSNSNWWCDNTGRCVLCCVRHGAVRCCTHIVVSSFTHVFPCGWHILLYTNHTLCSVWWDADTDPIIMRNCVFFSLSLQSRGKMNSREEKIGRELSMRKRQFLEKKFKQSRTQTNTSTHAKAPSFKLTETVSHCYFHSACEIHPRPSSYCTSSGETVWVYEVWNG